MAKIAVIGAGLFGVTIAAKLADKNIVDLYERNDDILQAASGINQFRLHKGYHYPRSEETVLLSLSALKSFQREFKTAIVRNVSHYYCIAKKKSLTTPKEYISFCERNRLSFTKVRLKLINEKEVDLCLKVNEHLIDPALLKEALIKKLKKPNLKVFYGKTATRSLFKNYDKVILCTYANLNSLLTLKQKRNYQYEVCEKIVVELPDKFKNKSVVVMDGPFMCVDPFGSTGYFLLGNVVHAIHSSNVGTRPIVSSKFKNLLNRGIIKNPPVTNFKKFIESASVFLPDIAQARYYGSMFTVRAVLPNKEKTDERPTIVKRIDKKLITVFSGKLVSSVSAASEVDRLIS